MKTLGRVLLIDSVGIIRAGLASLLLGEAPQTVIEEAETLEEAMEASQRGPWNLVVIDPVLERGDGVELVRQLRREHGDVPILVFTAGSESHLGLAAMLAGANGFLPKRTRLPELIEVLTRLMTGGEHASPALQKRVGDSRSPFGKVAGFAALSAAERRVLRELSHGKTAKEISRASGVGASTIGTYRARILAKLHLSTTADLVRYAVEQKLHVA